MKNIYCVFVCLLTFSKNAFPQTPVVYFDFLSHNEETSQWNGSPFYNANRLKLISLATYFSSKGITWNMQSDWVYLSNVISKELPSLTASTNNKNILRWMHEDKGVEMDPHAHESQYLYPDVVKLMDSIGLPESKLMGGCIYNDSNGINIWTNLVNGQNGLIFPSKFWMPDYMMGGGTPNHVADLKYFGFWNPQSLSNYLTNDTSIRLHHIGTGCPMKIFDTTNLQTFVNQLKEIVQNVQSGLYPSNGIYVQTIFFSQPNINDTTFYNKLIAIADSANAIVASGQAQWKTLKQSYTIWENAFNKTMFQWECGQIVNSVSNTSENNNSLKVSPNPASDILYVNSGDKKMTVYSVTGQKVMDVFAGKSYCSEINISTLPRGIYFLKAENRVAKFIKE